MNLIANLQKSFAFIVLTAMTAMLAFASTASAQTGNLGFTDDAEIQDWAVEAIDALMDQGVFTGNDDGSFAPNRQLNRAEVSKIIVLATGISMDATGGPHFPDVEDGAWYYDYIETMYNQGWINGYPDGFFRPGVGINNAEFAKMVVNAFEIDQDLSGAPHFNDVNASDWFYGYVETAYNNGIMQGFGDGTFGPANPVTRAQAALYLYNAELVAIGNVDVQEGTLEIRLSDDTPRGTNIPFNATSVPFTTIELTASDDADVEVHSLTLTRLGLGDNDDFDNVWLEIDGFKISNDKSVNNDDVVQLRFNPPIVVPAGQTLTADVVASLKYQLASDGTCFASGSEGCNIGHHNRLVVVSGEDVVSSASNLAGDFPVEGEEMEIADYRVSEVKFSRLGSDTTVDVGDSFIEIGKFRLLNSSTTNKDVELRAVTFKNDGTAELEDNLENVALYVSGDQVSAETIIDGDYLTFRLDNGITGGYILDDGDSRIFSIRADIVSAERDDVINFKIDNFEDIVAVEVSTAFGAKGISGDANGLNFSGTATSIDTAASCLNEDAEDQCARLRAYAVDAGDLNISRDPTSLGNQQYAPGANDVVFLTARLLTDQPVTVDGVRIHVLEANNISDATLLDSLGELNEYFDNFRLFIDDQLVDTENEFTGTFGVDGVGAYLDFNTTFEIASTSVLKLVGNIEDNAPTGSKLRVEVQNSAFTSPEYISTGDQLDDIQGSAQASFVEVEQSNLIITKTDGLSSGDRIVAGVSDVTFMKFVLDNNDSGDVTITSVSLDANASGPAQSFSNFTAAIFVDGVQQGSTRSLESDGTATFNDLNVSIESASQKEFEVVMDTLEASANSNPINSTLAAGANGATSEVVLGALISGSGTVAAGNSTATITAALVAAVSGDQIAVVNDGAGLTDTNTEINTLAADVTVGDLSLTVSTPFNNGHPMTSDVYAITNQYPIGTTVFTVVDASKAVVGEDINIGSFVCTVASVSGNNITCTTASAVILPIGTTATAASTGAEITLFVTAVDADNTENGQQVDVKVARTGVTGLADLGTNLLTTGLVDLVNDINNVGDGNCEANTTANTDSFLCGVRFALVQSGQLTVSDGASVDNNTNILVANTQDVEVYRIRLSAADDEVQIRDLFFVNTGSSDFGDRVDFKLYTEDGTLIQDKQMSGTTLHFELANADRIRVPKDDSVTVVIKVDVRDITKANQTGKNLVLALDVTQGTASGVEAVTVATGSDLVAADISGTATTSETYVAYRTMLTFDNAATQPSFAPAPNAQIFRFTASNDAAYEAILNTLTVAITPSSAAVYAGAPADLELVKYSSADYSGNPTAVLGTATGSLAAAVFSGFTDEVDGTNYYAIRTTAGYSNDTGSDNDSLLGQVVSTSTAPSIATTPGGVTGDIVWSDRSNNGGAGQYLNDFQLVIPSTAAGIRE